jgi:phage baseplate assembly protein W
MISNPLSIKYPIEPSKKDGSFSLNYTTLEHIKTKIRILFSCEENERYFNLTGMSLTKYLFEQNDETSNKKIKKDIIDSLRTYIPEITVTNVTIEKITDHDTQVSINFMYFGTSAVVKIKV